MMLRIGYFTRLVVLIAVAAFLVNGQTELAAADQQSELIAVLKSDAPAQDKAITCKKLAIYGDKQAVPVLAPLLENKELASWARIALEAIPDPACDEALRQALDKVEGRLLVGVINSIGVRRDAQAVPGLVAKLKDSDTEVIMAAAEALGHIGGNPADKALSQALVNAPEAARSGVAYGCILCAEQYLVAGKNGEASQLYDRVRQSNAPQQRRLEAIRGAILARGSDGLPLLIEQLRSEDKELFGIGLRTARELPGRNVTGALAKELDRLASDWQLMLFLAISDRKDEAVLPIVMKTAQSGYKQVRAAALSSLDRFHDASSVPLLLNTVAEGDPELTKAAKATLSRMEGRKVDDGVLARLPKASGPERQVLIELATQRQIQAALPVIIKSASDADDGIRHAALDSVAVLGNEKQAADLARLLSMQKDAQERERIERALLAICGRSGARCLPSVLPLAKNNEAGLRQLGLRLLASIGGGDALAAVVAAIDDSTGSVQDEAVSVLATWPNNWPDDVGVAEPLLALAKSGKKTAHHVQGIRGYLQYIQENKQFSNSDKVGKINELLPLLQRPEEKRLVIAAISSLPTGGSLELLMTFAADSAITEEVCLAIVKVASDKNLKDASKDIRQKALKLVAEKSQNADTRKQAEAALKRIG